MKLSEEFLRLKKFGEVFSAADGVGTRADDRVGPQAYTAKPGSHDDGPGNGPFYGGIGAPAFSRSLTGCFNRWHLQPGYHAYREIDSAALLVWWREKNKRPECRVLSQHNLNIEGVRPVSGPQMETVVLFPFTLEHYSGEDMPVELYLRLFSPLTADGTLGSSMPVVYFDIEIHNRTDAEIEAAAALFWPNQLGWRQPLDASEKETVCSWPARGNYGNVNVPVIDSVREGPVHTLRTTEALNQNLRTTGDQNHTFRTTGVCQTRNPQLTVQRDMEGEVLVSAYTPCNTERADKMRFSRELTFKTEANGTGEAPEDQPYTFPWVARYFSQKGGLPETEKSWSPRCHEGIGSAVAARTNIGPQSCEEFHFLMVHDLPLIEFGGGRVWKRAYCEEFGGDGRNAARIALSAIENKSKWEREIVQWQEKLLSSLPSGGKGIREKGISGGVEPIAGALINDLYFLVAGGTAWVSGTAEHQRPGDLRQEQRGEDQRGEERTEQEIALGKGPHFALLEGFDTGYYYYNTFDLWVYAFPAFLAGWTSQAESVFEDYLRAVDLRDDSTRIIYRQAEERSVLKAGKIPHDLGSAMEDPWNALNGYSWRDDPNVWRDHNPAFIVAYYLFRRSIGRKISRKEWEVLDRAAEYMSSQDSDGDGLPEHSEFGDSTWDALSLRGIGAYSGALALAALAVMEKLSKEFDTIKAAEYHKLRTTGVSAYVRELWNGEYFNNSSSGKYRTAIQADALFGIYLAELCNLPEGSEDGGCPRPLLSRRQVRSHLLAVYKYNFQAYKNGRVGPLLVSNPTMEEYARDGGEDLQLGEVIVGSAWVYGAMLDFYGLTKEAEEVETALVRTLYRDSGLQFRTPAAWDGENRFRAPLNMRPLAGWFLYLNRTSFRT